MTQEEKGLLFKDLCARIPYGTIIAYNVYGKLQISRFCVSVYEFMFDGDFELEHCKPYLRPMSSMTEEEVKDLVKVQIGKYSSSSDYHNIISIDRISMQQDRHSWSAWLHYKTESGYYRQTCFIVGWVNWETTLSEIDWLNSNHFDYRGLIEKGLALEAPKDMYK